MQKAATRLNELRIPCEVFVTSAHRTPDRVVELAQKAEAGAFAVIIAGAGGAAHLPGMLAAHAPSVPVLGVPIQSKALHGLDSLYSIVQMPAGVPVATFAIGEAGAENAALFAAQLIAIHDVELRARLRRYRADLARAVPAHPPQIPEEEDRS
jgi:5-(carboxyamino)imidazole ribonucleotide mutase